MALLSAPGLCEFKKKNILKIETCALIGCNNCNIEVKNWLDQPYEKPKIEIDWSRVPVDTPVLVWNDDLPKEQKDILQNMKMGIYLFLMLDILLGFLKIQT